MASPSRVDAATSFRPQVISIFRALQYPGILAQGYTIIPRRQLLSIVCFQTTTCMMQAWEEQCSIQLHRHPPSLIAALPAIMPMAGMRHMAEPFTTALPRYRQSAIAVFPIIQATAVGALSIILLLRQSSAIVF